MIYIRPAFLSVQGLQFAWSPREQSWLHWSAEFAPGLTVLVGGDGAGKTTRLRLLATALAPQAGQLVLKLTGVPNDAAASNADASATTHAIAQTDQSAPALIMAWPNPQAYRQHVFWCDPASEAHDALGAEAYVEHHRTLGDWVHLLGVHGFRLVELLEPEWPAGHDRVWGGWSRERGLLTPGTALFVADFDPRT